MDAAHVPFNISLSHRRRDEKIKTSERRASDILLHDRLSVIESKESCLFVSALTLPTCALSGQTQCPTMTRDSPCILMRPRLPLCSPQSAPKWQPASLRCSVAQVPLTSTPVCAARAPRGPLAAGVRGVSVRLLYSHGCMSASQRTGPRARERNT